MKALVVAPVQIPRITFDETVCGEYPFMVFKMAA